MPNPLHDPRAGTLTYYFTTLAEQLTFEWWVKENPPPVRPHKWVADYPATPPPAPLAAESAAFQRELDERYRWAVEHGDEPFPLDDGDDERTQALHAWDERNKAKAVDHLAEAERLLKAPDSTYVDTDKALLEVIAYLKERH